MVGPDTGHMDTMDIVAAIGATAVAAEAAVGVVAAETAAADIGAGTTRATGTNMGTDTGDADTFPKRMPYGNIVSLSNTTVAVVVIRSAKTANG